MYLDASALARRAEADGTSPSVRSAHCGALVQAAYDDPDRLIGLSRLTLVEFHNAVAITWRNTDPPYQQYGQPWADAAMVSAMAMVASGRFQLVPTPPQAEDHGIALVRLATREYKNGLHAWDAVHLITATTWGHALGTPVELWTSDKGFGKFVELFPHFKRFVSIVDLNP